jgi:hypothetical protein
MAFPVTRTPASRFSRNHAISLLSAAKLFKIDRKRVREWCKNKSAIENGQKSQKRLPGGGRPVRYKEIDNKLMAWFREK